MIRLVIISVVCAAWTLIGCTPTRVRQDVWPQPAGIDAPSWPAASFKNVNQKWNGKDYPDCYDSQCSRCGAPRYFGAYDGLCDDCSAESDNIPAAPLPQGDVHQGPVSNPQPLPERMAKSHLALDESHSSGAASVTPTAVSSFPAVPPADAGATLLPVAPRRLLVLFTAPKCAPCDDLKRLLAQCESQVYGDFIFREVDITTYPVGLNSAPWLALFDAGTERQIEGPTAAPKTLGGLKELLTRWGTL